MCQAKDRKQDCEVPPRASRGQGSPGRCRTHGPGNLLTGECHYCTRTRYTNVLPICGPDIWLTEYMYAKYDATLNPETISFGQN